MSRSQPPECRPPTAAPSIERRTIGARELDAVLKPFRRIYCAAFPAAQRRAVVAPDDGALPGPSIRDFVVSERAHLDVYFQRESLVGIALSIDLGTASLGDYMAKDPARPDVRGLGARMLADWLELTASRDQDAVAELEAPRSGLADAAGAHDRSERIRLRRVRLFQRLGFLPLGVPYSLPGGRPMLLMVHPRPSRGPSSRPSVGFAPDEVEALVMSIRMTYLRTPERHSLPAAAR